MHLILKQMLLIRGTYPCSSYTCLLGDDLAETKPPPSPTSNRLRIIRTLPQYPRAVFFFLCHSQPHSSSGSPVVRTDDVGIKIAGSIYWKIEIDHLLRNTHLSPYPRLLGFRSRIWSGHPFPTLTLTGRVVCIRIEAPSSDLSSRPISTPPLV